MRITVTEPKPNMGAPLYPHDSDTSVFLGIYRHIADGVTYDLYYQPPTPGKSWQETVIARHGPEGQYRSGMFAAHGEDRVLTEARQRAIAQRLISTPLDLHQDGTILVNMEAGGVVLAEGHNVVLLLIDTHSKYVEIDDDGHVDDMPSVSLVAGEATIKTNPNVGGFIETVILFPRYRGWRVACVETRGKYTTHVVLMKNTEEV